MDDTNGQIALFKSDAEKLIPYIPQAQKTFLEILKISQREVPMANLLAYFFNPGEKHGLGDLFIRSLLETECYRLNIHESAGKLKRNGHKYLESTLTLHPDFLPVEITGVNVITEDPTDEAKRIDILIEAKEFILVIEFKINHVLNNPLALYEAHILNNRLKTQEKPVFFIVLTPWWKKHEDNKIQNDSFRQITLSHFIENVKSGLSDDLNEKLSGNKYYPFLLDFIQTIENRQKYRALRMALVTSEIPALYQQLSHQFLTGHFKGEEYRKIRTLIKNLKDFENDIERKINKLRRELGSDWKIKRKSAFESFLQLDVAKTDYVLKIRLTLAGWTIETWENQGKPGLTLQPPIKRKFAYDTNSVNIAAKVRGTINAITKTDLPADAANI